MNTSTPVSRTEKKVALVMVAFFLLVPLIALV